jgi:hypothetical protein
MKRLSSMWRTWFQTEYATEDTESTEWIIEPNILGELCDLCGDELRYLVTAVTC